MALKEQKYNHLLAVPGDKQKLIASIGCLEWWCATPS